MGMKPSWLLRSPGWRRFHLHRCLECGRKFADTETGCWTDLRDHEFPELCHCQDRTPWGTVSHANCRAAGPYCPARAPEVRPGCLRSG